jgi:hypothetical protein
MTLPDPVEPLAPLTAEIVTTEGTVWSATAVASQAPTRTVVVEPQPAIVAAAPRARNAVPYERHRRRP